MKSIKSLKSHGFNTENETYIIAEVGINHAGSLDKAKKYIESAAKSGADAVKFQTYQTEKRTFKGSPIWDILKQCELPLDAFVELRDLANQCEIDFFSTPFDEESVDFLHKLNIPLYKIASFDVPNIPLLRKTAQTGKPIVMSVGMANIDEISKAYDVILEEGSRVALLHCISAYPTDPEDANLRAIDRLYEKFDCVIGQSDHTNDIEVPILAVAAGAQILEKHYKLDDTDDCPDSPVSITEQQMYEMVQRVRMTEKILGTGRVGLTSTQEGATQFRRNVSG